MNPTQIYEDSIADIDAISASIDLPAQARDRLMETKSKWIALARDHKGSNVERILQEALTRLPMANTSPASWAAQLNDSRSDFTLALSKIEIG